MAKEEKTKLTIMGEDLPGCGSCISSGNLIWGLFLIFSGIILLFNTLDIIPWNIWYDIIKFWPILLILAGLNIILGESKLSNLIFSILIIIIFVLVFLMALSDSLPQFADSLPLWIRNIIEYLKLYIR